jgi:hypothetical protein
MGAFRVTKDSKLHWRVLAAIGTHNWNRDKGLQNELFLDSQKDLPKLQKNHCGRVVIANMDFGQGSKS